MAEILENQLFTLTGDIDIFAEIYLQYFHLLLRLQYPLLTIGTFSVYILLETILRCSSTFNDFCEYQSFLDHLKVSQILYLC